MGGDSLQGALWSHTAYKKYLHAFATLGPGAPSCQVGTRGVPGRQPLDSNARAWSQHLCKSVQL